MSKVLFLLVTLFMFDISYAANPAAERPSYSAGDYWIYTDDDKEMKVEFLKEEKDRYIFEAGGTQVVKDFNLTNVGDKTGGYPGPIIKFPLTVGKWWNYEFQAETIAGSRQDAGRIAKYEVESYEQITVPAGTFWAFKITVTIVSKKFQQFVNSAHYWYAPEVKNIIKGISKGKILELKQYKIK
jgi:hypothetical protein